jgi:hypothetical protein
MALFQHLRDQYRPFALVGLGLGLTLTACGGSSAAPAEVASLGTTPTGATTETTTPQSTQEAFLAFAQCMRDNGVDMQDPTFDAAGNLDGGFGPGSGMDPGDPATRTALEACGELIQAIGPGGGNGGPQFDRTALSDAFNAFTGCLRDEGLDVDDIDLSIGPGGGRPVGDVIAFGSVPLDENGNPVPPPGGTIVDGGFQVAVPIGGPPGGPGSEGFDPTTRIIEQLGLDDTDPAVTAALDVCRPLLDDAMAPRTDVVTATTVAGS